MSNGHGGKRPGAGRKKKVDELAMIEALGKHIDNEAVFRVLKREIAKGNMKAISIYMNYMYGKPVDRKDIEVESTNVDLSVNKTYDNKESKGGDNDKEEPGNNLKVV